MKMFIIALFAALAGCDNYTEEVCTRSKIAQVLDCTGEQSTVSGGGIAYKGTGIADVSTNVINGKCRVEFDNGMRHTLDRPLAVGDVHVFTQDVEMIRKDGVCTGVECGEILSRQEYTVMTLKELIEALQAIERAHGGDETVVVTGLHSSEAGIESVKRVRTDYMSRVEIETDLFTG